MVYLNVFLKIILIFLFLKIGVITIKQCVEENYAKEIITLKVIVKEHMDGNFFLKKNNNIYNKKNDTKVQTS